jgi:hypothetical protein
MLKGSLSDFKSLTAEEIGLKHETIEEQQVIAYFDALLDDPDNDLNDFSSAHTIKSH